MPPSGLRVHCSPYWAKKYLAKEHCDRRVNFATKNIAIPLEKKAHADILTTLQLSRYLQNMTHTEYKVAITQKSPKNSSGSRHCYSKSMNLKHETNLLGNPSLFGRNKLGCPLCWATVQFLYVTNLCKMSLFFLSESLSLHYPSTTYVNMCQSTLLVYSKERDLEQGVHPFLVVVPDNLLGIVLIKKPFHLSIEADPLKQPSKFCKDRRRSFFFFLGIKGVTPVKGLKLATTIH